MRLLVMIVVLRRLVKEFGQSCGVGSSLPLASGKPRRDLLDQPTVPVGIFKRNKRVVRTTFRVAPTYTRGFDGIVKWSACVVEDLADINTACDQFSARGVDVVNGKDQVFPGWKPVAKDDRGF